uniref:Ionotropic receptor 13 n=1 Tax=Locusta migratoria TaxID=7004 RepID=A0A0K2D6R9_LOCMI|nr:ionotropic receptor 13 [Locusta migratoria]
MDRMCDCCVRAQEELAAVREQLSVLLAAVSRLKALGGSGASHGTPQVVLASPTIPAVGTSSRVPDAVESPSPQGVWRVQRRSRRTGRKVNVEAGRAATPALPNKEFCTKSIWLVFLRGDEILEKAFEDMYIPLNCQLLVVHQYGQQHFITEIFHLKEKLHLRKVLYGIWSAEHDLQKTADGFYSRRCDLLGETVKVSTFKSYNSEYGLSQLRLLSETLNFTYKFVKVKEMFPGRLTASGYSGMLGAITRREVDMTIDLLTHTTARSHVVDFLFPTQKDTHSMFIKLSLDEGIPWTSYLSPFCGRLWGTVVLIITLDAVALAVLLRSSGHKVWTSDFLHLLLDVLGMYSLQGLKGSTGTDRPPCHPPPEVVIGYEIAKDLEEQLNGMENVLKGTHEMNINKSKTRVMECSLTKSGDAQEIRLGVSVGSRTSAAQLVSVSAYVTAIVLQAAYCANVVSVVASRRYSPPFSDLAGLLADRTYRVAVMRESITNDVFEFAGDKEMKLVYQHFIEPHNNDMPVLEEDIDVILCHRYRYCFTGESKLVDSHTVSCEIFEVRLKTPPSHLGFALWKGHPYKNIFNYRYTIRIARLADVTRPAQLIVQTVAPVTTEKAAAPLQEPHICLSSPQIPLCCGFTYGTPICILEARKPPHLGNVFDYDPALVPFLTDRLTRDENSTNGIEDDTSNGEGD